jgi:hypothetical protein
LACPAAHQATSSAISEDVFPCASFGLRQFQKVLAPIIDRAISAQTASSPNIISK